MNYFDPFVLPFAIGLYTLLIIFITKVFDWIKHLSSEDKKKLGKGILSWKVFSVIKEIIIESLLHRKIFRVKFLLGYMHMSLAFGWFLLILFGTIESKYYSKKIFDQPWEPIFFKYFEHDTTGIHHASFFNFMMDILLLFVLSGLTLAFLKRIYSKLLGLKKTTRQKLFDKLAITSLWLIFPLRLLAESTTAGIYNNGGFLTNGLGNFFAPFLPLSNIEYTSWWLYSFAIGVFFVSVPFSRYMHIPTEIILIALRKFGIKTGNIFTSFSQIEVYSCPRCGICIDKCQLASNLNIESTPPVYFLNTVRVNKIKADNTFNCLICGRCQEYCPVGINITAIRLTQRNNFVSEDSNYSYLKTSGIKETDVVYYAGCMTHLTPSIKNAMVEILKASGVDFIFIDEEGGACCGRPLLTLGNFKAAEELIEYNKKLILNTKAKTLITSCAICYRVFKDNYNLPIEIMHHSQYILKLAEVNKIKLRKQDVKAVYHDPCELGRGAKVYDEPRKLLNKTVELTTIKFEKENALCCGGSLGNIMLSNTEKNAVNVNTLKELMINKPEVLITACPLCKKSFSKNTKIPIKDIAEIISDALLYEPIIPQVYANSVRS